jgi:hypothetical protein
MSTTVDQLAIKIGEKYYEKTQTTRTEYGGRINCNMAGTRCGYTVSPDSGKHEHSVYSQYAAVPAGMQTVAFWHTHVYTPGYANNEFDQPDIDHQQELEKDEYLITANGSILKSTFEGEFKEPRLNWVCYLCLQ